VAPAPLRLWTGRALAEWVDYNGHLRDGYYAVAFSLATDDFLDYLGLGAAYTAHSGCSVYTLEMHLNFLREVRQGEDLAAATQVLGHDAKRLHVIHSLHAGGSDAPAATNEVMLLHVDAQPRAAPMPPGAYERAAQLAREHAALARPAEAGRRISL
jgi:acyl-CoA thioester hydrolase